MFNGFLPAGALVLLCFIFIAPACKKETDCKAIITVTDTLGNAVENALVLLNYASATSAQPQLAQSGRTDASGKVSFTFQLEATWDITAALNNKSGTGIITLKPGETVEKTVDIR